MEAMKYPSFVRLKKLEEWGIRVPSEMSSTTGEVVTVHKRGGETQELVLGDLEVAFGDARLYRIAGKAESSGPRKAAITTTGVYEKDGDVFMVVESGAGNLYAKRYVELRETQADRVTEAGDAIRSTLEYDQGAVFRLKPEDRVTYERAKELSIRFGRCVRCGTGLEVKKSVEEGIGPVCKKALQS